MTTTSGIDARAYLTGWLQAVTGMTIADINAIPDDKWSETHGGCSRPCGMMLADTVSNLLWTAAAIRGEQSDAYDKMGDLAGTYADKAAAVAGLSEASAALVEAVNGASDETLNSTIPAPWGMPTPLFTMATISASHIWYHDGQLNYVQTLLGDDKVHWMP